MRPWGGACFPVKSLSLLQVFTLKQFAALPCLCALQDSSCIRTLFWPMSPPHHRWMHLAHTETSAVSCFITWFKLCLCQPLPTLFHLLYRALHSSKFSHTLPHTTAGSLEFALGLLSRHLDFLSGERLPPAGLASVLVQSPSLNVESWGLRFKSSAQRSVSNVSPG
jgi:hypothetical protein